MSIELPFYPQEKRNTCALACLRMVLAAFDRYVQESELEAHARMEPEGTRIDELERLARQFQLVAEIQETTVEELRWILAEGRLPIVYLDRIVFELNPRQRAQHSIRDAIIHNVIPTRVTATSVTFHDPRLPRVTRRTTRLFRQAFNRLGGRCVVCAKPVVR
jgi:ABC-type bacteriocin/lantibiotic exporter with double-glycine peptidase domain